MLLPIIGLFSLAEVAHGFHTLVRRSFPSTVMQNDIVRPLGGYERLLSRKTPGSEQVSLSHGCAVLLKGTLKSDILRFALASIIARHPMLHTCILPDEPDNKSPKWKYCTDSIDTLIDRALTRVEVTENEFDETWKKSLESAVNEAVFHSDGPLWKLTTIECNTNTKQKTAWIFCVNHGIDDQQSVNIMVQDMLYACESYMSGNKDIPESLLFPENIEKTISPDNPGLNTMLWAAFQLGNSLSGPSMLPHRIIKYLKSSSDKYRNLLKANNRRTSLQYLTLSSKQMSSLRRLCRSHGVTVTHALSGLISCATAEAIHQQENGEIEMISEKSMNEKIRFLLSVGLRSFDIKNIQSGKRLDVNRDFTQGTVACAGGAIDYILSLPIGARRFYEHLLTNNTEVNEADKQSFWMLAKQSSIASQDIINKGFVTESVRLFGLGMQYADVLAVVEMDANSDTLGRGYSCGVSNVGLVKFMKGSKSGLEVDDVFYCTSHARNGVLIQLSCLTAGEKFCGCLQFPDPIIDSSLCNILTDRLQLALNKLCEI